MPEATITRSVIIIVEDVGDNSYGDLTFTDKADGQPNQYKISAKRKQYFEKVILPGMAVQLNYAMSSFGKEYIYSAVQVKDKLPIVEPPPVVKPAVKKEPKPTEEIKENEYWIKKDRLTRKSIERQTSLNAAVEVAKLLSADGVDKLLGDKITAETIIATAKLFEAYLEGQSRLVEEAKKLGAVEIGEKGKPATEPKLSPDAVESISSGIKTPISSPVSNPQTLMQWALSHGKDFNASWVRGKAGLKANEIISNERAIEAYHTIKEQMPDWKD